MIMLTDEQVDKILDAAFKDDVIVKSYRKGIHNAIKINSTKELLKATKENLTNLIGESIQLMYGIDINKSKLNEQEAKVISYILSVIKECPKQFTKYLKLCIRQINKESDSDEIRDESKIINSLPYSTIQFIRQWFPDINDIPESSNPMLKYIQLPEREGSKIQQIKEKCESSDNQIHRELYSNICAHIKQLFEVMFDLDEYNKCYKDICDELVGTDSKRYGYISLKYFKSTCSLACKKVQKSESSFDTLLDKFKTKLTKNVLESQINTEISFKMFDELDGQQQ